MNLPKLVLWILLGYFTVTITDAQKTWWDLATDNRVYQLSAFDSPELFILGSQPICTQLPGLSQSQQKLCQLYQDHMGPIGDGAKAASEECKHQFTDRRWNCSSLEGQGVFGRATTIASRETAFTYAISSAAVAHSIARACREGDLSTCLCGNVERPADLDRTWEWRGCGDNIEYGIRFARQFVDATEMERNPERRSREYATVKMNLHNNEAGRKIIHHSMGAQCKCHGVSGSCSLKTCWPEMMTFRAIGLILKEKYNGASQTQINKKGKLIHKSAPRFSKPTRLDLVYLDESPDYCNYNPSVGSLGTRGRECNRTSLGTDGCEQMCCGRGYNSYTEEVEERCKCKFKWCCYVKCRKCRYNVERSVCK
uniref:Protein Wnt n=1 Tax=Eupentacta fraudatrix TaxID=1774088 RepID=A0A5B9JZR1_9ECHN|nr:Wnt5 protein [Eupentacta fraudatrix]